MNQLRLPEQSEFLGWLDDPVTQAVFELMRRGVAARKEQWALGEFEDVQRHGAAVKGARALGNCEAFQSILDLDYEQLVGELEL